MYCLQVRCHLVRPDQVSRAGHVVTVVLRAGAEQGLLGLWSRGGVTPPPGHCGLAEVVCGCCASLHNSLSSSGWPWHAPCRVCRGLGCHTHWLGSHRPLGSAGVCRARPGRARAAMSASTPGLGCCSLHWHCFPQDHDTGTTPPCRHPTQLHSAATRRPTQYNNDNLSEIN